MGTSALPGPSDDLAAAGRRGRARGDGAGAPRGRGPGLWARARARRRPGGGGRAFAFTDLPGFPPPGVPGHAGRVALGRLAGVPVAAFFGRVHFYEGHGMDVPALLPRLAQALGARHDGAHARRSAASMPELSAGTVVVLTDHLNLMGTHAAARVALPGRHAGLRRRCTTCTTVSSGRSRSSGARALGIRVDAGVYAAMSGPAYETPSEVRFLRGGGARWWGCRWCPRQCRRARSGCGCWDCAR